MAKLRCVEFLARVRIDLGGVTRAVLDLAAAMAQSGHRVVLITLQPPDVPANWLVTSTPEEVWNSKEPNLPAVFVPFQARESGRWLSGQALQQVRQVLQGVDVLHIHGLWEPCNLQVSRAARRFGVPYAVTPHGMLDAWAMAQKSLKKRLFFMLFVRRYLRRSGRVQFTAEAERAQAQPWVKGAATEVIPCLFDAKKFLATSSAPANDAGDAARPPHLLFLSRLHPKKGVERLIRAAAILKKSGYVIRWTVAGPGETIYLNQLRALAHEVGVMEEIQFSGLVIGREKIDLYNSADLFVLPTQQENFGLVLVEAMACGVPVLTTRGVDIWREIEEAGGVIVNQDVSPEKLAAAMHDCLIDRDALADRGRRGREWAAARFAPNVIAGEYERMYAAMSAERGPEARRKAQAFD